MYLILKVFHFLSSAEFIDKALWECKCQLHLEKNGSFKVGVSVHFRSLSFQLQVRMHLVVHV